MKDGGLTTKDVENTVDKVLSSKKQRNILLIILLLMLVGGTIFFRHYQNIKGRLAVSEQNSKALSDSVRVEKNRVGDLIYTKNILITDKKNLKNLNKDLADELAKQKGKISELNKIVAGIKSDTIYIPTEVIEYVGYGLATYGLKWDYDTTYSKNNFRQLSGISKFEVDTTGKINSLGTNITKDIINFGLVTGLREKDGNIEIFATSNYPNLIITELNGAIIDPKKHPVMKQFTRQKRFGIGPYIGFGLGINTIPKTNVGFGVQVGIGLQYNIFSF